MTILKPAEGVDWVSVDRISHVQLLWWVMVVHEEVEGW